MVALYGIFSYTKIDNSYTEFLPFVFTEIFFIFISKTIYYLKIKFISDTQFVNENKNTFSYNFKIKKKFFGTTK